MIGQPFDGQTLAIAEGLSTGASIHEATGWPIAIAFAAGFLLAEALEMQRLYSRSRIVLAGDDDISLLLRSSPLPNIGRKKAIEAASAVSGQVVISTWRFP